MTTKKQRREMVAEKTRQEREALAAENLAALERSRNKREQVRWEKERADKKKAAAAAIEKIAKEPEVIPENLQASFEAIDLTREQTA